MKYEQRIGNTKSKKEIKGLYVIEELNIDEIVILQDREGVVYEFIPNTEPKEIFSTFAGYIYSLSEEIEARGKF